MKSVAVVLASFCVLFLFTQTRLHAQSAPLATDRGRIVISTIPDAYNPSGPALKVLRTDTNTPLRAGTVWIWDKPPQEQPASYFASLRAKGLNGVRMILFDMWETEAYLPSATFTPTDWNDPAYRTRQLARMERAVNYASAEGLYVIINCHNKIPLYNATYANALWTYVAPYFANRTHVIYEASNEPMSGIGSNGNLESVHPGRLQQLKTTYNIIRSGAPQTHIMILTPPGVSDYGYGTGMGNLAEAFAALPGTVDWTKTSVAYHLYNTDGGPFPQAQNLRNLHSRFAAWPSENNFPASVSNATLGITDNSRSDSYAGHLYINQTCEFLGLGWSMWNLEGQTQLDRNWPIFWADAVAKGYTWSPDNLNLSAPNFTSANSTTVAQDISATFALAATPGLITYTASGLPTGLSLNPTSGLISSISTVAGTFPVAVTATNSAGSASATLTMNVTPTQEIGLYSETFLAGNTAGWFSYSGGTGVTSSLVSENAGTTDGKVLKFSVIAPNSYYAGIGITRNGTPPFTSANLARVLVRGRVQIQSSGGRQFSIVLKTGSDQSLTYNTSAPDAGWLDFAIPLSNFTNASFNFAASSWEILLVPDATNWGLGSSILRLDFLKMTRFDDITNPLLAWRKIYFNTINSNGSAANTYDADYDALANLLEYALGTSPVAASKVDLQPQVMGGQMQLRFTPQRSDVNYGMEATSDLQSWVYTPIPAGSLTMGQPFIYTDATTPQRRFLRLKVTTPQ